ncbi:hypothetical protein Bca4012_010293 [Brassica carinata]
MKIEHCMHELIPFLDILCAMSKLLYFESKLPRKMILNLLIHFALKSFSPSQMTWTI